jgi:betaine-aldehyde dehydrogenase
VGGVKPSGIGDELGPSGLDEYRDAKHIVHRVTQAWE